MHQPHDPWLRRFHPRSDPRLRLFCFPYAGRGASVYRDWGRWMPAHIEVVAVQLPGREDRFREPAHRRLPPLVDELGDAVARLEDLPFAYMGHSMGGLLAFELARKLRDAGRPTPTHLFVSGRRAPHIADPEPPIPDLPDEEFARELQRRYQGLPPMIADDPELRAFFLPMVRADLELVDTYDHRAAPPLGCPISAFGGTEDAIAEEELAAWQEHTTAACRVEMLPGDHFFINTQGESLAEMVAAQLA
jgi:surfactin synthase thioesterase subunit